MQDFDSDFKQIENLARERFIPVILDDSKEELLALVKKIKPKRILEIGTAIGYSGSLMLTTEESAILDTIELLEERQQEAITNFKKFGVDSRVNSYLGDAMELLPNIINGNCYDLVFIDGPKSGYIFCDNVLFRGLVANGKKPPHKFRTIVVGLRKFLSYVMNNSDFRTQIMEKGDGIAIIEFIK